MSENSNDVNGNNAQSNPNQAPAPRLPRGDRRRGQFRGRAPTPVPPAPKKPVEIVTTIEEPTAIQAAVDVARTKARATGIIALATSLSVKPAERDGCRVCSVESCSRLAGCEPQFAVAVRDGISYPICRPHCRVGAMAFLALREKGIRFFDSQELYSRARNEEARIAREKERRDQAQAAAKAAKERVLSPQEIVDALRAKKRAETPASPAAKKTEKTPSTPPAAKPGEPKSERALARSTVASALAAGLGTTPEKFYKILQNSADLPDSEWEKIETSVAKRLDIYLEEAGRQRLAGAFAVIAEHRKSVRERMTAKQS